MFNRTGFNRTKFNTSATEKRISLKDSEIIITAQVSGSVERIGRLLEASIVETTEARASKELRAEISTSEIILISTGRAGIEKRGNPNISNIILSSVVEAYVLGEANINLSGLILKPGDKLTINTCDMTITLNDLNAVEYLSIDSDFFKLLKGENTIEYIDDNIQRSINFDVIWKDKHY